jgi:ATP synthase protein I
MVSERRVFTVLVNKNWKAFGSYSTVGLELALSILVGLLGGQWLDRKLGAGGWLTFIGLGFGIAAGFRSVWRALQRANRDAERQAKDDKEARTRFHENGKR